MLAERIDLLHFGRCVWIFGIGVRWLGFSATSARTVKSNISQISVMAAWRSSGVRCSIHRIPLSFGIPTYGPDTYN